MNPPPVSVVAIARLVSEHFGVPMSDLTSQRREASIVRARHVVMYLARQHTGLSYPRIGSRLGGRDHTTIMHGARKIEQELATDETLARDIKLIEWAIDVERRTLLHFGLGLEPDIDVRELAERVLSTRGGEFTVSAREVILLAEAALAAAIRDEADPGPSPSPSPSRRDAEDAAAFAELIRAVGAFIDAAGRAARADNGEERILAGEERNSAFAALLTTHRAIAADRADRAQETEHA